MNKNNALIGFSGFVGSSLLKQTSFEELYNSKNIRDIQNNAFNVIVCAGAPAKKWLANKYPEEDKKNIQSLIECLKSVKCKSFILISTVDVFDSPFNVNEKTKINDTNLHPYGANRLLLERFIKSNFENSTVVRLPGLFGPGLKKNIIFDFLNNNDLEKIDSRSIYQFYPIVNLWNDIQLTLKNKIGLIHLTAEPINVFDIALKGFNLEFTNFVSNSPPNYNFKTSYSGILDKLGDYHYSKFEILSMIRYYAQSEVPTLPLKKN